MDLLITFFSAVLLLIARVVYSTSRRKRVYSSSSGIKSLLKPADTSLIDLLHQRAIPNQRLIHAKAKLIIAELSSKGEGWRMLGQTIDGAIARPQDNPRGSLQGRPGVSRRGGPMHCH